MKTVLELNRVCHGYTREKQILRDLSIAVGQGEIACLLGSSGCGKTTALRVIAGFERLQRGTVKIDGHEVSSNAFTIPPEKRRVGVVFQDAALFPHLSISGNIGFGLHRSTRKERERAIDEMLELVGLRGFQSRFPHQLSGGQRQRVALARAMAPKPSLILLDEPFSNLDADLRRGLCREVRRILKNSGITAVLVTHDQNEAFAMSDRIGILHEGALAQFGGARELFQRPANRVVAAFLGEGHFIGGKSDGRGQVTCVLGVFPCAGWTDPPPAGDVEVLIRPDSVVLDADSSVKARVRDIDFRGSRSLYMLNLEDGQEIHAFLPTAGGIEPGDRIPIRLNAPELVTFELIKERLDL